MMMLLFYLGVIRKSLQMITFLAQLRDCISFLHGFTEFGDVVLDNLLVGGVDGSMAHEAHGMHGLWHYQACFPCKFNSLVIAFILF